MHGADIPVASYWKNAAYVLFIVGHAKLCVTVNLDGFVHLSVCLTLRSAPVRLELISTSRWS